MARTDSKWYDDGNISELHEDLALRYEQTLATIERRPRLAGHFADCATCQQIKAEHENKAAAPIRARKRLKLVIRPAEMRQLLGLPAGHEIVIMYATMDPNTIQVILTGEDLPDAPEDRESPVAGVTAVPRAD